MFHEMALKLYFMKCFETVYLAIIVIKIIIFFKNCQGEMMIGQNIKNP